MKTQPLFVRLGYDTKVCGRISRENEQMPLKPQDESDKRRTKSSGFLVRFNELYAGSRFCISARSEGRKV